MAAAPARQVRAHRSHWTRRACATGALIVTLFVGCGRSSGDGIHFNSTDGFRLEGTIRGSGDKGVVLLHMFPADQSSWYSFADDLEQSGYLVLTFDFRGYGKSQGTKQISLIDRDVSGAIRFIKSRGARSVALVGASMGGTASLLAAASERVNAVATLSAPVNFRGLDASEAVGKAAGAKLFIASTQDDDAPDSASTLLRQSLDPSADLLFVPGRAHGTDMLEGPHADEVRTKLKAFLAKNLR